MITDELREYVKEQIKWLDMTKVHYRKLFAIADRIDAEHEKAMADAYLSGTPTNEKLTELGWVCLPVDADGVPIRFGDKVTVPWKDKVYEVAGFSYSEQLCGGIRTIWIDVYSPEKQRNVPLCGANSCHHYHAPTVEDVLREFALRAIRDSECGMGDLDETCAEYASKLRLAEEVDG